MGGKNALKHSSGKLGGCRQCFCFVFYYDNMLSEVDCFSVGTCYEGSGFCAAFEDFIAAMFLHSNAKRKLTDTYF